MDGRHFYIQALARVIVNGSGKAGVPGGGQPYIECAAIKIIQGTQAVITSALFLKIIKIFPKPNRLYL